MNVMPPEFHRRRVEQLSSALGVWRECANSACRRAGGCRRAGDVFPACLAPIVREVGASIESFAAAFGAVRAREADPLGAQIARINKRLADVLEKEIEEIGKAREKRHMGSSGHRRADALRERA
jgi:hypothetical protein